MCDPGTLTLLATAAAVGGQGVSTLASYQQGRYEAKVAEVNQRKESERAVDALQRGGTEAQRVARQHAAMIGAQRAAMAANGVDLSFGTAADFLADSASAAVDDQMAVRENARREAMGYDVNSANFGAQAKAARRAATGALIEGGLKMGQTLAGGAQQYKKIGVDRSSALGG